MQFQPIEVLRRFDALLKERGLEFKEAVVIGGAAISILYRGERRTQDIDVLTPIPEPVKEASREFAAMEGLANDWFNNRVVNLAACKPWGWGVNLMSLYEGEHLTLYSPSRENLLRIKLYSACDRPEGIAIDVPDIIIMKPTAEELSQACDWVRREQSRQTASKKERRLFAETLDVITKSILERTSADGKPDLQK